MTTCGNAHALMACAISAVDLVHAVSVSAPVIAKSARARAPANSVKAVKSVTSAVAATCQAGTA